MLNQPSDPTPPDPPPPLRLYRPEPPGKPKRPPTTLAEAAERFVVPALETRGRSAATIKDLRRSVAEWSSYWSARQSEAAAKGEEWIKNPLLAAHIKLRHLERWQAALLAEKKADGSPRLAPASVNRKLGAIRQVLNACQKRGKIKTRPQLEKLSTKPAPKFYLRREQMEQLWPHCDALLWPRVPGLTTGNWWRCALVLYWVYGFRTQELIAFQIGKRGLCWSAITLTAETPNAEGTAENALGWLSYVPQKQEWAKPEPLYLPLTRHTRAAVDMLRAAAELSPAGDKPADRLLFPWPGNHRALYREWNKLQALACVANKKGEPFLLKNLRKTAATYLENHHKGLGAAVCGWADRDVSQVMATHYAVDELTLVEKLASYPVPACFDQLLEHDKPQAL